MTKARLAILGILLIPIAILVSGIPFEKFGSIAPIPYHLLSVSWFFQGIFATYFPSSLSLLLTTIITFLFFIALYILSLKFTKSALVLELIILVLGIIWIIQSWGLAVTHYVSVAYMSFFVMANISVLIIFLVLVYQSYKRNIVGLRYVASLVFFVLFVSYMFPQFAFVTTSYEPFVDDPIIQELSIEVEELKKSINIKELSQEELLESFDEVSKIQHITKEFEAFKNADNALAGYDDPEAAYRLIEDILVSEYDEVREKVMLYMVNNPKIYEGARNSFSRKALRKSLKKYGSSAREIEYQRLAIYKRIAATEDYADARSNYEKIFGPIN